MEEGLFLQQDITSHIPSYNHCIMLLVPKPNWKLFMNGVKSLNNFLLIMQLKDAETLNNYK